MEEKAAGRVVKAPGWAERTCQQNMGMNKNDMTITYEN